MAYAQVGAQQPLARRKLAQQIRPCQRPRHFRQRDWRAADEQNGVSGGIIADWHGAPLVGVSIRRAVVSILGLLILAA